MPGIEYAVFTNGYYRKRVSSKIGFAPKIGAFSNLYAHRGANNPCEEITY
jgi:hypothetical protein